jgi:hypothetical protein
MAHYARGDYQQAIHWFKEAVVFYRAAPYDHFGKALLPSVTALSYLIWCLGEVGAFAKA